MDNMNNTTPSISIEELDFSVRTYHSLKRGNINSLSELLQKSEHDLLNIRNFGVKSTEEVIEKLKAMGLELARPILAFPEFSEEQNRAICVAHSLEEIKEYKERGLGLYLLAFSKAEMSIQQMREAAALDWGDSSPNLFGHFLNQCQLLKAIASRGIDYRTEEEKEHLYALEKKRENKVAAMMAAQNTSDELDLDDF